MLEVYEQVNRKLTVGGVNAMIENDLWKGRPRDIDILRSVLRTVGPNDISRFAIETAIRTYKP